MPKNYPILVVAVVDVALRVGLQAAAQPERVIFIADPADPLAAKADVVLLQSDEPTATAELRERLGRRRAATVVLEGPGGTHAEVSGRGAQIVLRSDTSPQQIALICELLGRNRRLRHQTARGRRQRLRLSNAALVDPLTELPNRRAWQRELQRAGRDGAAKVNAILALIDLDRFKQVNDDRGYAAGDRVLAAAARAIRQSVRDTDFIARLGGDEFGVLFGKLEWPSAATVIERVRRQAQSLLHDGCEPITMSVGYALLAGSDTGGDLAAFDAASAALRTAKANGRDQTVAAGVQPESGLQ